MKQPAKHRNDSTREQKHWLEYAIALFAFIAAIGGVAAAVFSGWQAWTASDAEKRQLRAYVFVNKSEIRDVGTERPFVGIVELKNFGNTPAYKIRRRVQIFAGNYPYHKFPDLPPLSKNTSTLGPTAEVDLGPARAAGILTNDQMTEIKAGHWAIYFAGAIRYFDAFDVLRCTQFRLLFKGNGTEIAPNAIVPLEHDSEGNSADEKCDGIAVE